MMTNKERYQKAFSTLHASDNLRLEEKDVKKTAGKYVRKRINLAVGALAVCFALLFFSESAYAYTDIEIRVFMEEDLEEDVADKLEEELKQIDGVGDVQFINGEEAWEDFQEKYLTGEDAPVFDENPLADSRNFELKVRRDMDREVLQREIEQIDGVRKVSVEETK